MKWLMPMPDSAADESEKTLKTGSPGAEPLSQWAWFRASWTKLRRSGGLNLLKLAQASAEFAMVFSLGKLFGISIITRYLANPNELITTPLLRAFGARIGRGSRVKRRLYLDNVYSDENSAGDLRHLQIASNCYIGDGAYFDLSNEIRLEDDVVLAGNVHFITHADCNRSPFLERHFPRKCEPIHVEKGAWIGYGSIILAGCRVGEDGFLAANSMLLVDMEARSVYAGSPAEKVRTLADE